jgi:hypothetical protein
VNYVPLSVMMMLYPKPVDYVGKEEGSLLGANVCDGSSLDPLRELVDGH